jgi:GH25 family lysozyme M1 (1,4-beta-N-acetylmuramidase)
MRLVRRALVAASILLGSFTAVAATSSPAAAAQSPCTQWLRIADVSNWQPNIDWSATKRSGIAGVYVLFGDGNFTSPTWQAQTSGAASVGLPWGLYYFARPNSTDPIVEADRFAAAAGAGTLPPVLDLEDSNVSASQASQWAQTFMVRVAQNQGRTVTLYTGGGYAWANDPALGPWPLWLAAYPLGYQPVQSACGLPLPYVPNAFNEWSLWQFTSVGNIGFGNVDLSAVESAWWEVYTGASTAPPGSAGNRYPQPVYGPGSIGPKVVQIQQVVGVEQTGQFDDHTEIAVMIWQGKLGLTQDGHWGPATERATKTFFDYIAAHSPHHVPRPVAPLHAGQSGHKITVLQSAISAAGIKVDHHKIPKTGVYDSITTRAVLNLRKSCHLNLNGARFSHRAKHCLNLRLNALGK